MSSWSGVRWVLYIFWRSGPFLRYHWQICFPIFGVEGWGENADDCNWITIKIKIKHHFNAVSLAIQKLFILIRSQLVILSFMSLALGDMSVRMLLCGMSEIFLPMFSSRTFMVLRLIFKSFIHLEFIFVYGVSWWLSFIFLHVAVQISQHHLLKRLLWLHFMLLPPLSNINGP